MLRIARVFPRRTNATRSDALSFTGSPGLFPPAVDAVHVSVAFSWDLPRAEELARDWSRVAPVTVGGPGTGQRGEEFTPGMYLREGYTITSRGCPNDCWFCSVPGRDGPTRELPIRDGYNVLDDNLLACSEEHIRAVFAMLARQGQPAEFTGGLEAARLKPWHVDLLTSIRLKQLFLAYDEAADWDPFVRAVGMLTDAGITQQGRHPVRCYVLMGYPSDSPDAADLRCTEALQLGVMPLGMLWRDHRGRAPAGPWGRLQREWANPVIVGSKMRTAA